MPGALSGVRVIDFTRMLAGPFYTVFLRELGARVIRVEFREGGDSMMATTPAAGRGEGYLLMTVNRGRKSVTLDLKIREVRKVALDLIAQSDILIENFAPGVMKKLGLDYKSAMKVNPKLIYCSMSRFANQGQGDNLPAFEVVARAMGSLTSVPGRVVNRYQDTIPWNSQDAIRLRDAIAL